MMNDSNQLNSDNLSGINNEYQDRTYNDLSVEFQKVHPSAVRACQLIGLMYNRLTLVENFSHKKAVAKIRSDHEHLAGFSERNISRSLPLDNPCVPRRVKPKWRKNSNTGANGTSKLSNAIQQEGKNLRPVLTYDNVDTNKSKTDILKAAAQPVECSSCIYSIENRELKDALEKSSKPITADNIVYNSADCINETHYILEFEFQLRKREILDYLEEPYLSLKDGDSEIWFSGKIDRKNGQVVSAKIGRNQEQENLGNRVNIQNE